MSTVPPDVASDYIKGVIEESPVPVNASIEYGSGFSFNFGEEEHIANLPLVLMGIWERE